MSLSKPTRYGTVAALFHWIIALLLLVEIYVGWTFGDMARGPARSEWFDWHKTLGISILLLTLGRIGWRLYNPPPPFPAGRPAWEPWVARVTHIGFYVILLALPLTGWAYISTGSAALESSSTSLAGGLRLPFLAGVPRAGHDAFEEVHLILVKVTYGLLALHVAAALKHLFLDRGTLGRRMPPFNRLS